MLKCKIACEMYFCFFFKNKTGAFEAKIVKGTVILSANLLQNFMNHNRNYYRMQKFNFKDHFSNKLRERANLFPLSRSNTVVKTPSPG